VRDVKVKLPDGLTVDSIFDKYCNTVYRLAFARTKNTYDADDILQTVFVKLCGTDMQFRDEEHIKAWLIRVTVNTSKNLMTSAWMRLTDGMDDNLSAEMQEKSEVYYAVMKLPTKYRTVVHLHYYEGYTAAQIARLLSSKEATVKTQLRRAREKLEKELKGEIFGV
jgi:RNA polymerase sigma-70 factor (ECF subfamily)